MTTPQLLWPPPIDDHLSKQGNGNEETERVDLLGLIPPNSFDDYSVPNREQKVAGVTLRADRVIMDRERYPDCDRSTQHKLSDDIQASCREQGYCISVKEWADKNQHRGTLRLRLRCRSSACRFQFQLNWDSKVGFWYISRRRCGTFVHTCKPLTGDDTVTATQEGNKRRLSDGKGSGSKRARFNPEDASSNGSSSNNNNNAATGNSEGNKKNSAGRTHGKSAKAGSNKTAGTKKNSQATGSNALQQALDSARSLLDLSRTPSSGGSDSVSDNKETSSAAPRAKDQAPIVVPQAQPSYMATMRLGDRVFLQSLNAAPIRSDHQLSLLSGASFAPAMGLSHQQKLAILRQHQQDLGATPPLTLSDPLLGRVDLRNNAAAARLAGFPPGFKAAMQQRCMTYPPQGQHAQALLQMDPRLLSTGLFMNHGGVVNL